MSYSVILFGGQMKSIDKNRFFREATLRICSSLDADVFLYESFCYIKDALDLPADYTSIVYAPPEFDRLIFLAIASGTMGGALYNDTVPIPEEKQSLQVFEELREDILITDSLDDHPYACLWGAKGYDRSMSQLSLNLGVRDRPIGTVNFLSSKGNHFTQEHAEMIALLKEPFGIAVSNAIRHQEMTWLKDSLKENNEFLLEELRMVRGNEIIGADTGLKQVMAMVRKVAALSSPVLLLGETGTGKEVIANAIHHSSNRTQGPFVKINCGAIPENLVDSELFGHEKGAFTGAVHTKKGRFELADKGTLFLDEIGELTPEVQVRLLRALQEKEIERVGGSGPVKVDIRIIAATHRNLSELVKEGKFREDLFFRLNVFPIAIPSLRERKTDILGLAYHFIQKKGMEMGLSHVPPLSARAHEQLVAYPWPGNVRELENIVERAIILGPDKPIDFNELLRIDPQVPPESKGMVQAQAFSGKAGDAASLALDDHIKQHIQSVLEMTRGRINGPKGAARLLDINPSTLRNKMKKLGIYKR